MQYLDSVISNPYQTSLAHQSDVTLALSCVCQCSLMVEETKNGQKKKTKGSANVCKSETDPNETFLGQKQISMGIEVFALTMAVAQVVIYCGLIGETLSFGFIPI